MKKQISGSKNLGEFEQYLFFEGRLENAYDYFGAHLVKDDNNKIIKTVFRVYAPNAKEVHLLCELNGFFGHDLPLSKNPVGVWEIEIKKNLEWMMYKYEILGYDGITRLKADPYGFYAEKRPGTASKVYDIDGYFWNDKTYLKNKKPLYDKPVNIYEMHIGSWIRKDHNGVFAFNELVPVLIDYLEVNNFTHVEFLPIYEYPLDMSWGYQGGTYYSVTSRYGVPKDLMYLIDELHKRNIGVILDFVLGHIVKDESFLYKFDGTHLYEYSDKKRRENVGWGTANLDFNKGTTKSYMLSAFHFFMKYFHVDGFRIDAVSNLIYYLGNKDMGINNEAINFIKEISSSIFKVDNTLIFSAEDSTDYKKVTGLVSDGAIGFNYKWNMGFMNDTLSYFSKDPIYRSYHHNNLTFGMMYAYSENFILPFSHDEVVHLKGSLINKMPGSYEDKFQQLKLLMTYLYTFPGKKLLFMGGEFAQFSEWNYEKALDWSSLDYESHQKYAHFFKCLTYIYKTTPQLFKLDHDPKGFKWIEADNSQMSIYAYLRYDETNSPVLVILNMTNQTHNNYHLGVPTPGYYKMLLDATQKEYYGYEWEKQEILKTHKGCYDNHYHYIDINIKPWGCYILKFSYKK